MGFNLLLCLVDNNKDNILISYNLNASLWLGHIVGECVRAIGTGNVLHPYTRMPVSYLRICIHITSLLLVLAYSLVTNVLRTPHSPNSLIHPSLNAFYITFYIVEEEIYRDIKREKRPEINKAKSIKDLRRQDPRPRQNQLRQPIKGRGVKAE